MHGRLDETANKILIIIYDDDDGDDDDRQSKYVRSLLG